MPSGAEDARFCCSGCRSVFTLLNEQGLTAWYDLAGGSVSPASAPAGERSFAWLEPMQREAEAQGEVCTIDLDVQGIHCAACVWLMNRVFERQPNAVDLVVNPGLGKLRARYRRGFDLTGYLKSIEAFGYLFGPSRKRVESSESDLPMRVGVCAAITMNVMLFSIAFYFGLSPDDPEIFALFTKLSVALSTGTVLVGGWPFFRAAWRGLRAKVLHLDLPIAVGIVLAYGTSLLQMRSGRGDLAYFDTLNTFITLMLVGRWLQQRVVERNRRYLLEDDGAEGLFVRREVNLGGRPVFKTGEDDGAGAQSHQLEVVPLPRVQTGDTLHVAPADLVPVDSELLAETGTFSTDWITGESAARRVARGERVPAGSFNGGDTAVALRALTPFSDSPLGNLLRQAPARTASGTAKLFDTLARWWVVGVLAFASLGLLLWIGDGLTAALNVTVALLIVTCPCAIGIATPLAYELAQARLRREGFFVRDRGLLDRLPFVKKVLFDKTGTLTLGRVELEDPAALAALCDEARDAAYDMAARSNHPVSRALAEALAKRAARFDPAAVVREQPGLGLTLVRAGKEWRLGRAGWAADGAGTVLGCDGAPVASFAIGERLRRDAATEVRGLERQGLEIWLVSGDAPEKAASLARRLGIAPARALGGKTPEEKAEVVAKLDQSDTLYLGDGVNDALAFEAACSAGTPAIDRPVVPGKADFFLVGEGLAPLAAALETAQRLRKTVVRILALALAYNAVAVLTSLAGLMTPLRAAVAMPLSSVSLVLFAVVAMNRASQKRTPEVEVRAAPPGPASEVAA